MPISDTKFFGKLVRSSFDDCDVDGSGSIDVKELYVAILLLFDKINNKLPAKLKVPKKNDISSLMKRHDLNEDGSLDYDEYFSCVKDLLEGDRRNGGWRKSLSFQVMIHLAIKLAIIPLTAILVKKALEEADEETGSKVPTGLIQGGLDVGAKLLKFNRVAF